MRTALFILLVVLMAVPAWGLSISGLSPGASNYADAGVVVISGSGFGTNALDIAWLGGVFGAIETLPDGTTPGNFDDNCAPSCQYYEQHFSPVYPGQLPQSALSSSVDAWSYNKAIDSDLNRSTGSWERPVGVKRPTTFDEIFAVWWEYWEPLEGGGLQQQFKNWRINGDYTKPLQDYCGTISNTVTYNVGAGHVAPYTVKANGFNVWCNFVNAATCVATVVVNPYYPYNPFGPSAPGYLTFGDQEPVALRAHPPGTWLRYQLHIVASSDGGSDGKMAYYVQRPNTARQHGDTWMTGLETDDTSCVRGDPPEPFVKWQWFALQNYWDEDNDGHTTRANCRSDDIFVQFGSDDRVELCNSATYESATKREIQLPKTWSDTEISIELNYGGSFALGDSVTLFVCTSDSTRVASGRFILGGVPDPPPSTDPRANPRNFAEQAQNEGGTTQFPCIPGVNCSF